MYIIYNNDGSVYKVNLTDFIQKGNNNVNSVYIAVKGELNTSWSATAFCLLPSGDEVPLTLSLVDEPQTIDGEEYSCYLFTIPAAVTIYEGNVQLSIRLLDLNDNTLFTYQTTLVINPSAGQITDDTTIKLAQYNSLLQYIQSIHIENYVPYSGALNDVNLNLRNIKAANFEALIGSGAINYTAKYYGNYIDYKRAGDTNYHRLAFPPISEDSSEQETIATREWANSNLSNVKIYKHVITLNSYPTIKNVRFAFSNGSVTTSSSTPNYGAKKITIISLRSDAFTSWSQVGTTDSFKFNAEIASTGFYSGAYSYNGAYPSLTFQHANASYLYIESLLLNGISFTDVVTEL